MSRPMPIDRGARGGFIDWFFFDWFPAEALGAVRFYFGLCLIVYLTVQFDQLFAISIFGAHFKFTLPIWYFELLGIEFVTPWMIYAFYAALMAACVLFTVGKWTKPAIIAIIVCIFYLKGVRDSISGDVHHRKITVVLCLLLFLFSKCHHTFSLDARKRSLAQIQDWEASWPLRAMQLYIVMYYFWALMAKLRLSGLDWFAGGGKIHETLLHRSLRDGLAPNGDAIGFSLAYELAQRPEAVFLAGAAVFAFEFFSPLILFTRNKLLIALFLAGATAFHICNYIFMNVQFFLYPFVFVTFFNMAVFHRWLVGAWKSAAGKSAPAQRTPPIR
jgi:hypothetical protein